MLLFVFIVLLVLNELAITESETNLKFKTIIEGYKKEQRK